MNKINKTLKVIKIPKDSEYILVLSRECGINAIEAEAIANSYKEKLKPIFWLLVDGDVNKVIKLIKFKK